MTEKLTFGGASGDAPPVVSQVQTDPEPNGEVVHEGSLMEQLRNAAVKQQEEKVTDLTVGGEFRKQLLIRYRPLDPGPMDRFISRRSELREKADELKGLPITELNMDLMAQACVAVVGADANGENKIVLEDGSGRVRLEHRLAVLLGLPVPSEGKLNAREVIMMIFGGNAMAIVDHGDELLDWMRDPTNKLDVGES